MPSAGNERSRRSPTTTLRCASASSHGGDHSNPSAASDPPVSVGRTAIPGGCRESHPRRGKDRSVLTQPRTWDAGSSRQPDPEEPARTDAPSPSGRYRTPCRTPALNTHRGRHGRGPDTQEQRADPHHQLRQAARGTTSNPSSDVCPCASVARRASAIRAGRNILEQEVTYAGLDVGPTVDGAGTRRTATSDRSCQRITATGQ